MTQQPLFVDVDGCEFVRVQCEPTPKSLYGEPVRAALKAICDKLEGLGKIPAFLEITIFTMPKEGLT